MNTNLVFDAQGYASGLTTVLAGFQQMVDDFWTQDVIVYLVDLLGAVVVIVGVWYGVRAILRAMRTPK